MNKMKKTLIAIISAFVAIIVIINASVQIFGQILLPHSKNPYEHTSAVSTIAYPYLHHGRPDAIDDSLVEMTGEKVLIYEDRTVNGKHCDIRYTITESNTLHEVAYYFDVCQENYLDSKLPNYFNKSKNEDNTEYNYDTGAGGEYITCVDNGAVIIEYFC